MVIDYKDVTFSFKEKRKKKFLIRIKIIIAVMVIISLYFFFKSFIESKKIENLQKLLLQNKVTQVFSELKKIENSLFFPDTKKELKALVHLFNKQVSSAGQILEKLLKKSTRIEFRPFLDYFSDYAKYRELQVYTDYLLKKGKEALFYKILYKTAFFEHQQSHELIKKLPAEEKTGNKKELEIIEQLNKEIESGRINYISDINGKPLAFYDVKSKRTVSLIGGIDFSPFHKDLKNHLKFYKLTIDKSIQGKLQRLFRDYYGSFLLLKLNDSSIIAAYSKPVTKKRENSVFSEEYVPASIIKVLTLFTYLKHDGAELFPLNCEGTLRLNNKTFHDWWTHGRVSSYNQALAVSCNIAFARMGLKTGFKNLAKTLEDFYFNSSGFKDNFFNFGTGIFNKNVSTDFQVAKLSVGLSDNDEKGSRAETLVTTTTFHSALISALIAQNGSIYSPYLINSIKNVLSLGFYTHKAEIISAVTGHNRIFYKIKEAMKNVVASSRGTGRRARVDFVQTAVKTGTVGDKRRGYDAILTGFFPAERPKYAFAFILQKGGKAELRGALFLKDFLISFYKK